MWLEFSERHEYVCVLCDSEFLLSHTERVSAYQTAISNLKLLFHIFFFFLFYAFSVISFSMFLMTQRVELSQYILYIRWWHAAIVNDSKYQFGFTHVTVRALRHQRTIHTGNWLWFGAETRYCGIILGTESVNRKKKHTNRPIWVSHMTRYRSVGSTFTFVSSTNCIDRPIENSHSLIHDAITSASLRRIPNAVHIRVKL